MLQMPGQRSSIAKGAGPRIVHTPAPRAGHVGPLTSEDVGVGATGQGHQLSQSPSLLIFVARAVLHEVNGRGDGTTSVETAKALRLVRCAGILFGTVTRPRFGLAALSVLPTCPGGMTADAGLPAAEPMVRLAVGPKGQPGVVATDTDTKPLPALERTRPRALGVGA